MDTFQKWWEENYGEFSGQSPQTKRKMNMAYDVGVEHQQAKVEELQKRVDAVKKLIQEYHQHSYREADDFVFYLEQALKGEG